MLAFDFPLLNVRKLKEKNTELSFLTKDQIRLLYRHIEDSTNPSLRHVVDISLATGARWSECEGLTLDKLQNGGFYFTDTKNGSSRFVPVSADLFGRVYYFLRSGGFASCYGAFRSAVKRSGIVLPDGQLAHVLRHSFASHFMMSGGNIRTLQQILGHSSLNVSMRYAHFAPDFLDQAVRFNPLENL